MLCQKCHRNRASVRYAEVVDGQVNNLQLCQDCLSRQQEDPVSGFELSGPLPALSGQTDARRISALVETKEAMETCTTCSTTLKDIIETGNVGCSTCYETFPAQLESLLEGIHTALIHRGKTPRVDDERARARSRLQNKRALLKTALSLENYEEAAGLRDEIRALESGTGVAEAGTD